MRFSNYPLSRQSSLTILAMFLQSSSPLWCRPSSVRPRPDNILAIPSPSRARPPRFCCPRGTISWKTRRCRLDERAGGDGGMECYASLFFTYNESASTRPVSFSPSMQSSIIIALSERDSGGGRRGLIGGVTIMATCCHAR